MLEYHAPLQDLIRGIASGSTLRAQPPLSAPGVESLREQASEAEAARKMAEQKLSDAQRKVEETQTENRAQANEITRTRTELQKIRDTNGILEQQLQQARRDLDNYHAKLERSSAAPAELNQLRTDTELAQRLELTDLPKDNNQAMIRVVAVLAQLDNIERLWNVLKNRCEMCDRPASDAERALFGAALTWHNHNWRTRPYQLKEVLPGTAFQFEQQQRSRHSASGETVKELRLPGLADGSDKIICKILVSTH
jgi:myosin heavy subunit